MQKKEKQGKNNGGEANWKKSSNLEKSVGTLGQKRQKDLGKSSFNRNIKGDLGGGKTGRRKKKIVGKKKKSQEAVKGGL